MKTNIKIIFLAFVVGCFFLSKAFGLENTEVKYQFVQESRIGFKAKSTLHPFIGETRNIDGEFVLNTDEITLSHQGKIQVVAGSLDTENKARDNKMRQHHLEVSEYPFIEFNVVKCQLLPDENNGDERERVLLTGTLTLHGVDKVIDLALTLDRSDPNNLKLKGETVFNITDFNIKVPSVIGLIKMNKEVSVYFDLIAEPVS